jgi:hypothetical protein
MLKNISIPRQLKKARGNLIEAPLTRLHYELCFQGIHSKQITSENIQKNTNQQWERRLNLLFALNALSKRGKLRITILLK